MLNLKWYAAIFLLILAFAGGWAASSYIQRSVTAPTAQPGAVTTKTPPSSSDPIDVYSGNGMSPAALYNELDVLSGTDFDKRYINYVILMQANLTGINRLAKDKSVAPALKEKANELWQLDAQRLTDLYALQRTLGYSHH